MYDQIWKSGCTNLGGGPEISITYPTSIIFTELPIFYSELPSIYFEIQKNKKFIFSNPIFQMI
jgi:hypothetical protein